MDDLPPLPTVTRGEAQEQEETHGSGYRAWTIEPQYSKVVLMLVDALRSLIDSHKAIPFTALASAPTVTLPRLKALTTGTVPGFLDAILNIAESDQSSTLSNQDNWVAQMTRSPSRRSNARITAQEKGVDKIERRKIGFFGDDTWIKLFPGLFSRSDGTSSFFAMDTVEVDNNVTRHVSPELAKDDWDGLIFHYLGLDHVGHSGGPKSTIMRPKQAEMDAVAETIYKTLLTKDSAAKYNDNELPTLFILCGDHGMNEVGNHGGSSRSEISTSFLFMSSRFDHIQSRDRIQAAVDPYRHASDREEYQYYKSVNQVDLVPTLSLLLGLPIPKNNVGRLIPELFMDLTELEQLRALQLNAHQVAGVLRNMWPDFEVDSAIILKDFLDPNQKRDPSKLRYRTKDDYLQRCSGNMSDKQRLVCWYTLALEEHVKFLEMGGNTHSPDGAPYTEADRVINYHSAKGAYSKFLSESSSMLSTALSKYDMPLLTNGSLLMAFAVVGFIYCAMQTSLLGDFKSSCQEPRTHSSFIFDTAPATTRKRQATRSMATFISNAFSSKTDSRTKDRTKDRTYKLKRARNKNEVNWTAARVLSVVVLILYLVTLFASSFVEEEHQFWYFFSMTWWTILGLTSMRYLAVPLDERSTGGKDAKECVPGANVDEKQQRFGMTSFKAAGYCFMQMVILRLLRSWNQTGQKYADQIDLRHYLNSTWSSVSWVLFGLSMMVVMVSMIALVFSIQPPVKSLSQRHSSTSLSSPAISGTPAWRSAAVAVVQALLTIVIILISLWITVYKMDVESVYFGDVFLNRVHGFMSTLSSVGYPKQLSVDPTMVVDENSILMSGYEMARGCYAGFGAIVVLTLILKALSPISPLLPTPQSEGTAAHILHEQHRTLLQPSMFLGVTTLLLILLSRRHNAPIFVLFGIQLQAYLQWIALVRQYPISKNGEGLLGGARTQSERFEYVVQESDDSTDHDHSDANQLHSLPSMQCPSSPAMTGSARMFRTLPGQSSIHSCTLLLCTLSSFFLLGNSNSIASIDISNAYVGIQAYDIFLTGVLTFVSNWAGPIWWCLAGVVVMRWDLEWEMAWARQDKMISMVEEEERAWKTVQGWKREEKGTWTRKSKRLIQLYKDAVAKRDAAMQDSSANDSATMEMPVTNPKVVNEQQVVGLGLPGQSATTATEDDPPSQDQDGDAFYVYEKQDMCANADMIKDSVSPEPPCALKDPQGFRYYLTLKRILDHLILTSFFFGISLYALSIAAIILRHHLFIWTVFSPKVLYQFAWTVLFQVLIQVVGVGIGIWATLSFSL
ncbi:major facilitator super transporter protein [Haplosporangium sp. Z 11]|nr:major facilitator super transporter protein [Haplosporangium sp. Z 11]